MLTVSKRHIAMIRLLTEVTRHQWPMLAVMVIKYLIICSHSLQPLQFYTIGHCCPSRPREATQTLKKMGHSRPLFLYFRLFYKQLTVNKCSIKVADDWNRTRVLWYRKWPLCQLRHNHFPMIFFSMTKCVKCLTFLGVQPSPGADPINKFYEFTICSF